MSANLAAVSLSSSVAGRQSPSSKAFSDHEGGSSQPMSSRDWDMQGMEFVQENNVIEYYPNISPPVTPGLSWDSRPTSASLSASAAKSTFDDWEDTTLTNSAIVVEDDGVQTVLIPADSPFFTPPSPHKPFGFAPFSNGLLTDMETPSTREFRVAEACSAEVTPVLTNKMLSTTHLSDQKIHSKGLSLLVDATYLQPRFGSDDATLSSPIFSTPSLRVDDASWAPKGFMAGPDVPLDCIYTAGDISPIAEHWEGAWSPIVRGPFRSAPCL